MRPVTAMRMEKAQTEKAETKKKGTAALQAQVPSNRLTPLWRGRARRVLTRSPRARNQGRGVLLLPSPGMSPRL